MIGSIIGDIVGSVYEFTPNNIKTKQFEFFNPNGSYTDDSILTFATADWLLHGGEVAHYYSKYGEKYPWPMGGYGGGFKLWLVRSIRHQDYRPYNSCGNGSAMRVGPVGWAFDTIEEILAKAKEISSHNSKREMDMLMAAGEQISIALLAMAIEELGCPAISLLGWQAGFRTNSVYSAARIKKVEANRIRTELDNRKIVVVAGFQGINQKIRIRCVLS